VSSLLHPGAVRVEELTDGDHAELLELLEAEPVVNAVVQARVLSAGGLSRGRLGGSVLGTRDGTGRLSGALFQGGNLIPVGGGPQEWAALAEHAARTFPSASSIVGPATAVSAIWRVLAESWPAPRIVRSAQPVLVLDHTAAPSAGDPRVRAARATDLDRYVPAAAAMFAEELQVSPYRLTSVADYRRRVAALIAEERAFAVFDHDGDVIFKADLGAVTAHTCQVQGVWVRPDLRGRGLGRAALAQVLRHALQLAPTVSLYVNDFNTPARRLYAALGMRPVTTFSTVLF
jgi:predicted GNAT family acetyltransferase